MRELAATLLLALGLATPWRAAALEQPQTTAPLHRIELGFFDIHVCNWSDRPLFFMALFSTTRFDDIAAIEILDPDGRALGSLDTSQYRLNRTAGQPDKRVFIRQIAVPGGARDGWYSARVTARNGATFIARDFVVLSRLPIAEGPQPAPGAEDVALPSELRWQAIGGARHYQVFIQDLWDEEKLIYTSPLLAEPRAPLPAGLLKAGGYYAWRIHARDVNEHELLGDFNHGSLGPVMKFSVAP